jgi:putative membrane protein
MILWIKALHIVAVISWMAGLLYLPRLFVYHAGVAPGSATSELFKTMEYRLLRYIMAPASMVVWTTGPLLAWLMGYHKDAWFLAKMAAVVALTYAHHQQARWRKDFAADKNTRDARFFRFMNEVPTVLMIVIVLLVVLKPF